MSCDLSILIPARNEMFLSRTIQDILEHINADTEIIAVLDGYWAAPGIQQNERVTILHYPESIGQRAATNKAAAIARGKYVMKVDAHCAFAQGFDTAMLEVIQPDWTMAPLMKNLHAFDWVCKCGNRTYQGPKRCSACGSTDVEMDVVWRAKPSPNSTAYRFDNTMHFQYDSEYRKREGYSNGIIVGYSLSFDPVSVPSGIIGFLTNLTRSHSFACRGNTFWLRENMPSDTVSFSAVNDRGSVGTGEIFIIRDKTKVGGITAPSIPTYMIDDWNMFSSSGRDGSDDPGVDKTMCQCFLLEETTPTIPGRIKSPLPIPASGNVINSDIIEELNNKIGGNFVYSEKTRSFHNGSVTLDLVYHKGISESMSLQGSCWMATRDKYFELGLCDEEFGSWGQQGVEVACKTWLSGGKVMINHNTWYAHMFRTQADFGFPYPLSGSQVSHARKRSRELFPGNGWDKAVHDFDWLIRKFAPVPDWGVQKGIVYYTCNTHKPEIDEMCRDKLDAARGAIDLTCVSLNKPLDYGERSIQMDGERGPLMMHKQILEGLKASPAEVIFLCESDVLYHPSHFEFTPKRNDVFYYNVNVWRWKYPEKYYVWTDDLQQVSGLCAHRDLLIDFYEKRIAQIEAEGFNRHYEPGVKQTIYPRMRGGVYGTENWQSSSPNICIRHEANLTKSKWSPDEFRNPQYAKGWESSNSVPGWDN